MDEYGYAATATVALHAFEQAQRGSGRTSRLVERAGDDDVIATATPEMRRHVEQMVRRAGKKTRVVHLPANEHPFYKTETAPKGRTFFDHDFISRHYQRAIEAAARDLEEFQRGMSKTWPESPKPDSRAAGAMIEWAVRG